MANPISLQVRKPRPAVVIIDISGDLSGQSEQALMDAYQEASNSRAQYILLNFSNLDYMNSSGIGLLVTLLIRVQRQKQTLLAYGLSSHYQQIFELTRLNEAIGIHSNEAAALAAVPAS